MKTDTHNANSKHIFPIKPTTFCLLLHMSTWMEILLVKGQLMLRYLFSCSFFYWERSSVLKFLYSPLTMGSQSKSSTEFNNLWSASNARQPPSLNLKVKSGKKNPFHYIFPLHLEMESKMRHTSLCQQKNLLCNSR